MIHRDHRRSYEASSALNQILHREGPAHMQVGDLDSYAVKWIGEKTLWRGLEHKQADQKLGKGQERVLTDLAKAIHHAVVCPESPVQFIPGSGIYIVRGALEPETGSRRKVDFAGKQILTPLWPEDDAIEPASRAKFYDWLNHGPDWEPRRGRGRWW
jgi:hypothetical protein